MIGWNLLTSFTAWIFLMMTHSKIYFDWPHQVAFGAALAAPYCCKHSRATLRPHGPAPVRTPQFLDGLPSNTIQQQIAVQESATIHDRSRILLSAVDRHAGLVILENPSTSMTWDDPLMYEWVHAVTPYGRSSLRLSV